MLKHFIFLICSNSGNDFLSDLLTYPPVCLSVCLSLSGRCTLIACFFYSLAFCLSVCLSVCLLVCPFVCPFVCPSISVLISITLLAIQCKPGDSKKPPDDLRRSSRHEDAKKPIKEEKPIAVSQTMPSQLQHIY